MTTTDTRIPVCDLARHYRAVQPAVDAAIQRVLASGWYVLGAEVATFERAFADYLGVKHCIGVANGTDALTLACLALGIGQGDDVLTASMTATPTANGISAAGARPVFADVTEAALLDPALIGAALTPRTRAIMPIHLYGQMTDMTAIMAIADRHELPVIEDAAQAHGAREAGRMAGTVGAIGCFSFYPTKNLGAFGDGGACVTNDDALADRLRLLRNYGQRTRYEHAILGRNSRLDELQAAALGAMLPSLTTWTDRRRDIANRYDAGLGDLAFDEKLRLPMAEHGNEHVWHLYTIWTPERDTVRDRLADAEIDTQVHYPTPVHLQPAYTALGGQAGDLPVTERLARQTLSLPMFPELTDPEIDRVIAAVRAALNS